ncbi:MAG: Maf family nucleotide pyrophosphatase [Rickettsia endosymbiont of Bryobia graminum]|nr:Maf family nucleotide pyrophosphatase [Rickettsia endosymbiont of Bryobia graminum]
MSNSDNLSIILASQSPARLEILKRLQIIPSKIIPADIDESELPKESPDHLALRLACEKAELVAKNIKEDSIIIGADTVVTCGKKILPKALTNEDIRYCLNILSGRTHKVYTGLCIIKKNSGELVIRKKLVQTIVKFKRLTDQEIEFYCNLEEGMNKAGGCGISGYAEAFMPFIKGSHSNIMGLPMFETRNMLISLGYK